MIELIRNGTAPNTAGSDTKNEKEKNMEKSNDIATNFIILEDFIIKGNKVINETAALQALNRLSDFFVAAGVNAKEKEIKEFIKIYKGIGVKNIPGYTVVQDLENLLKSSCYETTKKDMLNSAKETGNLNIEIIGDEEKMINRHLQTIKTYFEEEGKEKGSVSGDMAEQSLSIVEYYIKGLSNISKKFEEEWGRAKNKEATNNVELQFGINTELSKFQSLIAKTCDEIKEMLLDKNRKYGNSALCPKRIFSRADSIEQINVRIDDKLSRIESAQPDDMEDPVFDLLGYIVLRRVAEKINNEK